MSDVITLLAELFLIGCIHLFINLLIDGEKMPFFSKVTAIACYAGCLFILVRFIANNLMPQMTQIFRTIM